MNTKIIYLPADCLLYWVQFSFSDNEINEIKNALYKLTQSILTNYDNLLSNDQKSLISCDILKNKIQEEINHADINQLINFLKIMIEELQNTVTPQFARQARIAFIAKSFCKSLVSKNIVSKESIDFLLSTLNTVATNFSNDLQLFLNSKITKDAFISKYGHLRLGSYDITAKTYNNIIFNENKYNTTKKNQIKILKLNKNSFNKNFSILNLQSYDFVKFIKKAIEQREFFKFEYTKSLSLLIEIIAKIGEIICINREEMAFLELEDIFACKDNNNAKEYLLKIISKRKQEWLINSKIELPEIIQNTNDFDFIKICPSKPNFISEKSVIAEIANLQKNKKINIENKIVLIEKADPGYDWIFTKNIKGLITKYGGEGSHMAIKCYEFGVPAALGCGEQIYSKISKMKRLYLDCKNCKILECETENECPNYSTTN